MRIPLYQVDAFTSRMFRGNPAAVCPLESWLPDATMQAIAAENNLAETAFFVSDGDGYLLRWFTPTVEVDLCGHATLASAYVLFNQMGGGGSVTFQTLKAGPLTVETRSDWLEMDFPSRPPKRIAPPDGLADALGATPQQVWAARDTMAVFETAEEVLALKPDFAALAQRPFWAVIATAPGRNGVDFVSRFFAPAQGVAEDPVTGSAHCTLTPYWAERLGKTDLIAHQISRRGGELKCGVRGQRVTIAGQAVLYMQGEIRLPE